MYKKIVISLTVLTSDDPEKDSPNYSMAMFDTENEAANFLPKGHLTRKELLSLIRKRINTNKPIVTKDGDDTEYVIYVYGPKNPTRTELKEWLDTQ